MAKSIADGDLRNWPASQHPEGVQAQTLPTSATLPASPEAGILVRSSGIEGQGAFAARDFPQGTRIVEYVGERISKAEALLRCEANNPYIFVLDEKVDLDGNVPWNPARFLNHSCAPNCEAELVDGHIWIIALRDIGAGEELTFNYGYDLEDYRDHPCRCGATECVGFMVAEEFFPQLRRLGPNAGGAPRPAGPGPPRT